MITLKFKIGKSQLEYTCDDAKKAHIFSSVYGALPDKCDVCGKDNIFLSHRSAKEEFEYYLVQCKDCGASLALHERKSGKGFYVKQGEKMEVYNPSEEPKSENKKSQEDNIF
jgi:transcription elongation factor Elf1